MTKSRQLRMTRQRRVIIEELAKLTCHPTADELYKRVRRRLPKISLGTVYRNLDILSQAGRILRLDGEGQRRFDARTNNHYHVRCDECGSLDDVLLKQIPRLERVARRVSPYRITGHRLEFTGLCPACLSKADRQAQ